LVVIDSVSTMLLRFGTARTFQVLGELRDIFSVDDQPRDRSAPSIGGPGSTLLARTLPACLPPIYVAQPISPFFLSFALAVVHADVHDAWTVECLEQMATTVLRFLPRERNSTQWECQILNKRPSGRITLEVFTSSPTNLSQD
jgi:hypothetical protein